MTEKVTISIEGSTPKVKNAVFERYTEHALRARELSVQHKREEAVADAMGDTIHQNGWMSDYAYWLDERGAK